MTVHPERIIPRETPAGIIEHHLAKYRFALRQDSDGLVLDAACGVGYATEFTAAGLGRFTVGVDISRDAMAEAAGSHAETARFVGADVTSLPFPDATFGLVLGFETIEHVTDAERYVAEVRRVLRPHGLFVCSTPYVEQTDKAPGNPYHLLEMDPGDLEAMLRRSFAEVELHTQIVLRTSRASSLRRIDALGLRRRMPRWVLTAVGAAGGSRHAATRSVDDFAVTPGIDPAATEVLAVCRGAVGT